MIIFHHTWLAEDCTGKISQLTAWCSPCARIWINNHDWHFPSSPHCWLTHFELTSSCSMSPRAMGWLPPSLPPRTIKLPLTWIIFISKYLSWYQTTLTALLKCLSCVSEGLSVQVFVPKNNNDWFCSYLAFIWNPAWLVSPALVVQASVVMTPAGQHRATHPGGNQTSPREL